MGQAGINSSVGQSHFDIQRVTFRIALPIFVGLMGLMAGWPPSWLGQRTGRRTSPAGRHANCACTRRDQPGAFHASETLTTPALRRNCQAQLGSRAITHNLMSLKGPEH